MGRWRSKLLLTLIVYAAGFATAVYVLSPPEASAAGESKSIQISQWLKQKTAAPTTGEPIAGLEAKPWADTAHAAIGKAAAFAKTQSVLLAEAIKAKVETHKRDGGE